MSLAKTQTELIDLTTVVSEVADGKWGLPEFQRDFIWSDAEVRSLLATVLSGWPAGSLLLMEATDETFALRQIDGAPHLVDKPTYAILDGQQRVTSLYQALHGAGDRIYAVTWDTDIDDDLVTEDLILSFRRTLWHRRYDSFRQQAEAKVVPFSALRTPSEFFEWRDLMLNDISLEKQEGVRNQVTLFYSKVLSKLHSYRFPAVILKHDLEPEAIANIFERVNKTGVRLNTFDLMVAKTYQTQWNLREKFAETKEKDPHLAQFLKDDGLPILQSIALMHSMNLRQSAVLNLSAFTVRGYWDEAVDGMSRAVAYLRDSCGVLSPELQPYPNMLPVIAAVLAGRSDQGLHPTLDRWFWTSIFSGAFEVAANTRLVTHFRKIVGGTSDTIEFPTTVIDLVGAKSRSDKALRRAIACFVARTSGASQWARLEPLTEGNITAVDLFPVMKERFYTEEQTDYLESVLNTFLCPVSFRGAMSRRSPLEKLHYLSVRGLSELYTAQTVPPEEADMSFLRKREESVINFVIEMWMGKNDPFIELRSHA